MHVRVVCIADNTDDGEDAMQAVIGKLQRPADRILVIEQRPRQRSADDCDVRRAWPIVGGEIAARQARHADRVEEAG